MMKKHYSIFFLISVLLAAFAFNISAETVIIQEDFTNSIGGAINIPGLAPDVTNLPGGTWTEGAGWNWAGPQKLGYGTYLNACDMGENGEVLGISLASNGSYTKPTQFRISADVEIHGSKTDAMGGVALGFYSVIPTLDTGDGDDNVVLPHFTGLKLTEDGALTLYEDGVAKNAIAGPGITRGTFYTLSYDVNTTNGTISNVSLQGSTSTYNFTSTAFADAATTFAAYAVRGDRGAMDNFVVSEVSAATTAPSAPTELAAVAGDAIVTLTWAASTGATSYSIYRGTAAGEESATPVAENVTALNYTDNDVTNGTAYYYKVKASNSVGASDYSAEASATPVAPTVQLPIQFSTNTAGGAVWYIIEQGKNDSNEKRPWVPKGLDVAIGIRWSAPNPENEDELFCFVGDNTNGFYIYNKAYLTGKTVGGVTLTEDLKLQNLGVYDPGNMWGGTAKLGFTAGTTITGDDLVNKFIIVEGDGTNHDGQARIGHYKICAATASGTPLALRLDGGSNGDLIPVDWGDIYFNTFLYVSGTSEPVPSAPTGLAAVAGDAKVTLTWAASTDAIGYSVYRGTAAGEESATSIAENITALSYIDNDVTNGTAYYYKVKASNSAGASEYSTEVSATPVAPTGQFPIQFSTNTLGGAVWYIIEQDKNASNEIRPWVPNGLNLTIGMRWSAPNPENEDELFCFVGDNTNGFYIYNKAYLTGKTVGGVTLTEDLKLQNLGVYDPANMWSGAAKLGFTTGTTITGNDLVNKFIIVEGDGTNHDGDARIGHYKICAATGDGTRLAMRLDGGSNGELIPVDWGDIYFNTFRYASGVVTNINDLKNSITNVYVTNGTLIIDSEVNLSRVEVFNLTGLRLLQFSNVQAGLSSHSVSSLMNGAYVIRLTTVNNNAAVYKVIK